MSLPSSMADFVPCDRLLQKAYCDPKVDKMSLDYYGARNKIASSNIYQAAIIGFKDYEKGENKRCICS